MKLRFVRVEGHADIRLDDNARRIELLANGWVAVESMSGTLPTLYPPSRILLAGAVEPLS